MAANLNQVMLAGTVTRDIELRNVGQSNTAVCDVSIAINDKHKNNAGEWVEDVTYVDVTCWGRTAEVASQYLVKGSNILVEGKIKIESWTDKQSGQKRSKTKVNCERLQMLGGKPAGAGGGGERQQSRPAPQQQPAGMIVDDGDVPF